MIIQFISQVNVDNKKNLKVSEKDFVRIFCLTVYL